MAEGKTSSGDADPLIEIQRKKVVLSRQLIQIKGQMQMKQRAAKGTELTIAEIKTIPEDTQTYRAVGRMFLLTPMPEVRKGLKDFLDETLSDIEQLKAKEKYVEKQAKSVESELKQVEAESTGG
eukprot:jgi/Bigna1/85471/estExt_fgenesh1_pg.C_40160